VKAAPAAGRAPAAPHAPPEVVPGAQVVILDDMDEVRRRVRSLIPAATPVDTCGSANDALRLFSKNHYRVVFFDIGLPVAALPALLEQCRKLQPRAVFVAIALAGKTDAEMADLHLFDDVLHRPFEQDVITEMVDQYSGQFRHVVTVVGEALLRVGPFRGGKGQVEPFFSFLEADLEARLRDLVGACFERVTLDLSQLPAAQAVRAARFVGRMAGLQQSLGLEVRLVVGPRIVRALGDLEETKAVRTFASLNEAKA
jgi:CheY-like chemotaxis protein